MTTTTSVAMTGTLHRDLANALLRDDGQEDIRLITYAASTGSQRRTGLLKAVIEPLPGDRQVHGNATITSSYFLRASTQAAAAGLGVAMAHSHPGARRWQSMSGPDIDAESSFANLVREITGLPLIGLTIAGRDEAWSARHWDQNAGKEVQPTHSSDVRVIGDSLVVSLNDHVHPVPQQTPAQVRTVSAWGDEIQSNLVRRRVLVVGLGSVGLDVATRLAASGCTQLGFMDFDRVENVNLDRLIGATRADAANNTLKVDVAERVARAQSTAAEISIDTYPISVCDPQGHAAALDYDIIFSCVDRPWPRSVLNALAYTDYIPVIDGGIAIDAFEDGGMRNATWRSHVVGPERPCMSCIGQLDPADVPLDIEGLLDDPSYINGANATSNDSANVALLSGSVSAALLAQYVSLNVAPGGIGDPGPTRYLLSTHTLERVPTRSRPHCPIEMAIGRGDSRLIQTGLCPNHTSPKQQQHPSREFRAIATRLWRRLISGGAGHPL